MRTRDKEVLRETAATVGALFEELMALKPSPGRAGVRGSLMTPEQAVSIVAACAPDILDRVVNQPAQATRTHAPA